MLVDSNLNKLVEMIDELIARTDNQARALKAARSYLLMGANHAAIDGAPVNGHDAPVDDGHAPVDVYSALWPGAASKLGEAAGVAVVRRTAGSKRGKPPSNPKHGQDAVLETIRALPKRFFTHDVYEAVNARTKTERNRVYQAMFRLREAGIIRKNTDGTKSLKSARRATA